MVMADKALAAKHTLILTLMLFGFANCQKFSFGSCPVITPVAVAQAAVGGTAGYTWYEYARTWSHIEHPLRCQNYVFTYDTTNVRYALTVTGINKLSGDSVTTNGLLTLPQGNAVGLFYANFPSLSPFYFPMNYYVIQTDANTGTTQTTYIVLYSCKNVAVGKLENVIVLTSMRFPLQTTIDTALGAAATRVPSAWLKKTDQTNC